MCRECPEVSQWKQQVTTSGSAHTSHSIASVLGPHHVIIEAMVVGKKLAVLSDSLNSDRWIGGVSTT